MTWSEGNVTETCKCGARWVGSRYETGDRAEFRAAHEACRESSEARAEWQRCPVCEGRGIVPQGFYSYLSGQSFASTSTGPASCRQCGGSGLIVRPATKGDTDA